MVRPLYVGMVLAALSAGCGSAAPPATDQASRPTAGTAALQVTVEGLRTNDGVLRAALFASEEGFPGEVAKAVRRKAVAITGQGTAQLRFSGLPPGVYAVQVFHDANANNELDTNLIGIPAEGVGASNNPRPRMGPPTYEDSRFDLPAAGLSISITVTYI